MNSLKKILALLLALGLMLSFAACGADDTADDTTEAESTETTTASIPEDTTEETPDANLVVYTVHIVDEEGNPVTGGMVQFCLDSCSPVIIDENGTAVFKTAEEADYEVKFLTMPEGYTYATEEEVFHFAEGEMVLTIVLKAAQ